VHRAEATVPPATVAIIPGASVRRRGHPSPALRARLDCGLSLYRSGRVQKLLASGDHRRNEYDETEAMGRWLIRHGVHPSDVFLDYGGFRTFDTMHRAAQVFKVQDATICTQAYHLPRALFLAVSAGINAHGLVAGTTATSPKTRRREVFATGLALLDTYLLGEEAETKGPPHPITGDGRETQGQINR